MIMKFYYKGQKVSKKDAKEQIDRVWGKGTFDKRGKNPPLGNFGSHGRGDPQGT